MAILEFYRLDASAELIGAIDCSFVPKAGKHTYGLDRFWSGVAGRAKQGLEISLLSLINTLSGEAWSLYAEQTPSGLVQSEGAQSQYTRIDHYLNHWRSCLCKLKTVRYFAADGFYAKRKVFDAFEQAGKYLITKLRSDADLRYLFKGEHQNGKKGRKRLYDGKVFFDDLNRWENAGPNEKYPHLHMYTQILNSPRFKRNFRVVLLLNSRSNQYVLLISTDLELPASKIVYYYQLRFQIEFLFRDAKQFAGLNHCQARGPQKLHFHFNLSLAAINLAKLHMKLNQTSRSFNDFARKAYNQRLLNWLFSKLSPETDLHLNQALFQQAVQFGTMHQPPN